MNNISGYNQINIQQESLSIEQAKLSAKKHKSELTSVKASYAEVNISATYAQEVPEEQATYTVDMEKVHAMKAESEERLFQLFHDTVKNTGLKQLQGLRSILKDFMKTHFGPGNEGSSLTSLSIDISYTQIEASFKEPVTDEEIAQAQADIAPGGYWSAEETSNRLVDFAKALSGEDPEKIGVLQDAFKKAFKEIEEMFGGTLPDISYDTYDMTMKKFDEWANEE